MTGLARPSSLGQGGRTLAQAGMPLKRPIWSPRAINWVRVWRTNEREAYSELRMNIDAHSLDSVRANAAPSNLPSFAEAFNAKPGDAMVRTEDQRVKIW